jgi:nucleoid DNA-binding protein
MPTAKKTAPAKKTTPAKKAAPVAKKAAPAAAGPLKPLKTALNKTALVAHLAETTGQEPKAVKAVLAALEGAVLASVHKKGVGEFTMPGLFKVGVLNVPAKKKRVGIDPFTKQERTFAAKPATVKIKLRALKKLKDAAL